MVLDQIENWQYKYGDLKAIFGNIVSQAFAQTMGIEENFHSECTEIFNMFFLKHVISKVTSPLEEEDPIEWIGLG